MQPKVIGTQCFQWSTWKWLWIVSDVFVTAWYFRFLECLLLPSSIFLSVSNRCHFVPFYHYKDNDPSLLASVFLSFYPLTCILVKINCKFQSLVTKQLYKKRKKKKNQQFGCCQNLPKITNLWILFYPYKSISLVVHILLCTCPRSCVEPSKPKKKKNDWK